MKSAIDFAVEDKNILISVDSRFDGVVYCLSELFIFVKIKSRTFISDYWEIIEEQHILPDHAFAPDFSVKHVEDIFVSCFAFFVLPALGAYPFVLYQAAF
jgi:hypothetical protein